MAKRASNPDPEPREVPSGILEIPLVALRETVIFPEMIVPLQVGRTKSVAALNAAMETGGPIALVTQRRPEQEIEKEITKFRREMFSANWPSIETKFKETHTLFIAHLIKRFPGLTENELKLAVLFTMGLSTRDISAITFVSYEGIRKARTRLRNALRLEPDTDLEEFLKAIEKEL